MTGPHEETGQEDRPLLDPAAVKRLRTLLTEIAGMHLGLGRLLRTNHDDCQAALHELHKAIDDRLEEACTIIGLGNVEAQS